MLPVFYNGIVKITIIVIIINYVIGPTPLRSYNHQIICIHVIRIVL